MTDFLKILPKDFYQLSNTSTSLDVVTNITNRFSIADSIKSNASLYYTYIVQNGDTPENLSFKYYGKTTNHWIILMLNDIVDPQFDWPMDEQSNDLYIEKKYKDRAETSNTFITGLNWAKTNIKSYYRVNERRNLTSRYVTRDVIEIDPGTYANISNTTSSMTLDDDSEVILIEDRGYVSYYDYEKSLNEIKREIKILKPEYVPLIEKELEDLFQ